MRAAVCRAHSIAVVLRAQACLRVSCAAMTAAALPQVRCDEDSQGTQKLRVRCSVVNNLIRAQVLPILGRIAKAMDLLANHGGLHHSIH